MQSSRAGSVLRWMLCATVALAGCGGDGSDGDGDAGGGGGADAGDGADAGASAGDGGGGGGQAVIGPEGGELQSDDGRLTLVVPEGALSSPEEITITSIGSGDLGPEFDEIDVGYAYELEPDGLEFHQPVTAHLLTDQQPVTEGGALEVTSEFLLTSSGGEIEFLGNPEIRVDLENAVTLTGELSHFSPLVGSSAGGNVVVTFEGVPTDAYFGQEFTVTVRVSAETLRMAGASYADISGQHIEPVDFTGLVEVPEIAPNRFEGEYTYRCVEAREGSYRGVASVDLADEQPVSYFDRLLGYGVDLHRFVTCHESGGSGDALETGLLPAPAGLTELEGIFPIGPSLANLEGDFLAALAGAEGYVVFDLAGGEVVLDRTSSDISAGGPFVGVAAARGPDGAAALVSFGANAAQVENAEDGEFRGPGMPRLNPHFDAFPAGGSIDADEVSITSNTTVSFFHRSAATGSYLPSGYDQNVDLLSFGGRVPVSAYTETQDGPAIAITWVDLDQSGPAQLHFHPRAGAPAASGVDLPGNDARKVRCAGGVCAISLFDADQVAVATWDGSSAPSLIETPVDVGDGPLGLDLFELEGGNVAVVVANFNDASITRVDVTPAGEVAHTASVAALDGCEGPGHIARIPHSGPELMAVVSCRGGGNLALMDLEPIAP